MTTPPAGPRTTAAIQARRITVETMLGRVRDTLRRMRRERARISIAAVARQAGVARTFLYQNPQAYPLVVETMASQGDQRAINRAEQAVQAEASWRERALNAEDALKLAHNEILLQRNNIGRLLGRVRDLEHDLPEDGIQRTVTENTTLKHQTRQFTQEKAQLEERLRAARDNNRFLDKRIACLETDLLHRPDAP
jgi:hypothetical protein